MPVYFEPSFSYIFSLKIKSLYYLIKGDFHRILLQNLLNCLHNYVK